MREGGREDGASKRLGDTNDLRMCGRREGRARKEGLKGEGSQGKICCVQLTALLHRHELAFAFQAVTATLPGPNLKLLPCSSIETHTHILLLC